MSNPVPADVESCAWACSLDQNYGQLGPSADIFKHPIFRPPLPVNTLTTMSQSLPSSTTVLVVGAGPAGMACALSLWSSGVRDMVIVDAVEHGYGGDNSSRAFSIHASTLEVRSREPFCIPDRLTVYYHNRRWILLAAPVLWSNAGSKLPP
jgi:hypothetical protein